MSTRGNYVFCRYPRKEDKEGNWVKDPAQIVELKKGISDETPLIQNGYKIYVHSDNYPSYALPNLIEFLNCGGAKARANDVSYLSAWFIAYHATNRLLRYNVEIPEAKNWKERSEFRRNYVAKGEDILNTNDFTGIGLENVLSDWANYTYVIIPDTYIEGAFIKANGFRIFIFDYEFNFIDEVHSTDDLKEIEQLEWWD